MEIKRICDALGIQLISYSPLGLGMLTGKYTPSKLPSGPRYINGGLKHYLPPFMPQYNHQSHGQLYLCFCSGLLFKQILPGLDPLLALLKEIAQKRRKTIPQVSCSLHIPFKNNRFISEVLCMILVLRGNNRFIFHPCLL